MCSFLGPAPSDLGQSVYSSDLSVTTSINGDGI